jgi:predicted dehydrogenase
MVLVAVIGAGFMGQTHVEAYHGMKNARVAAVCDSNEEKGRELAQKAGCPWFGDAEEMLRTQKIDLVDICLPTFLHEQYVLLAAAYKKHVFCEKPVTLTAPAVERMLRATREAGVQFMVGQVVRYWPEYVEAYRLYRSGQLGKIEYARASRLSVHPKWSEWYSRAENSGGGLFDLHLHDVDFFCRLFGRVDTVYATGVKNQKGCWNHVVSMLNFENGVHAVAEGVIEMPDGFPFTMELSLAGDRQALMYHMDAGDNLENVAAARRATWLYEKGQAPRRLDIQPYDAYAFELQDFVNHIEKGELVEVITPADIRHVLYVILAIQRSLESGSVVKVED